MTFQIIEQLGLARRNIVRSTSRRWLAFVCVVTLTLLSVNQSVRSQSFDFEKILKQAQDYTVIVKATLAMSMGAEPFEFDVRGLGTVVTNEGLVMIDGSLIDMHSAVSAFYGGATSFDVRSLTVTTLSGVTYDAEWLGSDNFSGLGFLRLKDISDLEDEDLSPVRFRQQRKFSVGQWLALLMLLPENITPPLAVDIGLVNAIMVEPEQAPLIVGFSDNQINAVLYNSQSEPIGVLASVGSAGGDGFLDPGSILDAFGRSSGGYPLLGALSAERLKPLIENPPQPGVKDRGWLGVSFQALNSDIAAYWNLDLSGGVIINEVVKNSPAEKAGLEVGDVIVSINDDSLNVDKEENLRVFSRVISELGAGAVAEFAIMRPDTLSVFQAKSVVVELGQAPITSLEAETYEEDLFEFSVRDMVFSDYLMYNLDQESFQGAWVTEIRGGGWADLGGLRSGDIVQMINSQPVTSSSDLKTQMQDVRETKPSEVVFFVWRNNRTLFVNIKPIWSDDS